jgi:hypothetical protein
MPRRKHKKTFNSLSAKNWNGMLQIKGKASNQPTNMPIRVAGREKNKLCQKFQHHRGTIQEETNTHSENHMYTT